MPSLRRVAAAGRSGAGAVPDDRLGDLGRDREGGGERAGDGGAVGADGRAAGEDADRDPRPARERLAELDARAPEPVPPSPGGERASGLRPGRRYMWVVAAAVAVVAIVAAFDSARQTSSDRSFLRGLPPGTPLPVFAAPLATGRLEGDANVKQRPGGSDAAGTRPACEVRSPDVVNLCELRRRPLALTFIVTRGTGCGPDLALVDSVSRDFPQIAFAAVVSGDSRTSAARLVRRLRVRMPVAVDQDGAVLNLYRVGVCPTLTLAEPGGVVRVTRIGRLREDALRRDLRSLAGSARR
jgi:hypothetical protein